MFESPLPLDEGALQAQQRRHPRRVTPWPCLIWRTPRRTGLATTSGSMGRAAMGAVETPFPAGKPDVSRPHGVSSTEVGLPSRRATLARHWVVTRVERRDAT